MKTLVVALTTLMPQGGAPHSFIFLPEGRHKITPSSHPKGITVNVQPERGDQIVAALRRDLDKRLGENVKPWFDFEHSRKYPASGYPQSFHYERGKGVICTSEWSTSGANALTGGDARYFSPEVFVDIDGVPIGLPERGPWGALTCEPAFRDMPALAASYAGDQLDHREAIFATDAGAYLDYLADLSATGNVAIAAREQSSPAEIEQIVAGLLDPSNFGTPGQLTIDAMAAEPELYDRYLERLEAGHHVAASTITGQGTLPERVAALVAAGQAGGEAEAVEMILQREPSLYGEYLATLARR